jgi:hypothetical protein
MRTIEHESYSRVDILLVEVVVSIDVVKECRSNNRSVVLARSRHCCLAPFFMSDKLS